MAWVGGGAAVLVGALLLVTAPVGAHALARLEAGRRHRAASEEEGPEAGGGPREDRA